MSHWFKVKTKINDVEVLKRAATQMGYMITHNRMCRGYNNQETLCDLVMALPGQYDMGFQKQEDGSYEIIADFWAEHISQYLGNPDILKKAQETYNEKLRANEWDYNQAEDFFNEAKISGFMQAYNNIALEEMVKMQGLQYISNTLEDGSVVYETIGGDNPGERIIATVSPAGDLKIEAAGFSGTSCTDATAFLQNLGIVKQSEYKPEFYDTEEIKLREGI